MSRKRRGPISAALVGALLIPSVTMAIPSVTMAVECDNSGPTEEDYRKAYAIVLEQAQAKGVSMTPDLRKVLATEFADCVNVRGRQGCRAGTSLLLPHPEMWPVLKHILDLTIDVCWQSAVIANAHAIMRD